MPRLSIGAVSTDYYRYMTGKQTAPGQNKDADSRRTQAQPQRNGKDSLPSSYGMDSVPSNHAMDSMNRGPIRGNRRTDKLDRAEATHSRRETRQPEPPLGNDVARLASSKNFSLVKEERQTEESSGKQSFDNSRTRTNSESITERVEPHPSEGARIGAAPVTTGVEVDSSGHDGRKATSDYTASMAGGRTVEEASRQNSRVEQVERTEVRGSSNRDSSPRTTNVNSNRASVTGAIAEQDKDASVSPTIPSHRSENRDTSTANRRSNGLSSTEKLTTQNDQRKGNRTRSQASDLLKGDPGPNEQLRDSSVSQPQAERAHSAEPEHVVPSPVVSVENAARPQESVPGLYAFNPTKITERFRNGSELLENLESLADSVRQAVELNNGDNSGRGSFQPQADGLTKPAAALESQLLDLLSTLTDITDPESRVVDVSADILQRQLIENLDRRRVGGTLDTHV